MEFGRGPVHIVYPELALSQLDDQRKQLRHMRIKRRCNAKASVASPVILWLWGGPLPARSVEMLAWSKSFEENVLAGYSTGGPSAMLET